MNDHMPHNLGKVRKTKRLLTAICALAALSAAAAGNTKVPGRARFALCQTPASESFSEGDIDVLIDWARGRLPGDEDVIVFPELAFTTFSEFEEAWRYAPEVWDAAAAFAVERSAWVFVNHPSREYGETSPMFNETRVFSPDGTAAATYRKRILANMDRAAGFSPGSEATLAELPFGRIGLLVCKDSVYPDNGLDMYFGADMIVVQFAHPGVENREAPEAYGFPVPEESLSFLRDTRMGWLDLEVPFAGVNKTGPDGNYVLCGGTFISDIGGGIVVGEGTNACVVVADIELCENGRLPSPPPFEVTFDACGGSVGERMREIGRGNPIGALPAPVRNGHKFLGWFTGKDGGAKVAASNVVTGTATLYARWAATTYKVSFNANGGSCPKGKKMAAQKFTYGKAAKLAKNVFVRPGYVFVGWAKSKADAKNGAVSFKNAAKVKNLRSDGKTATLYAVWANKSYGVKFYANGGEGKMAVERFTYGKAKKLNANQFRRKGYKFAGWATSKANAKAGKVKYKNRNSVKNLVANGKTVKLYAVWKR